MTSFWKNLNLIHIYPNNFAGKKIQSTSFKKANKIPTFLIKEKNGADSHL